MRKIIHVKDEIKKKKKKNIYSIPKAVIFFLSFRRLNHRSPVDTYTKNLTYSLIFSSWIMWKVTESKVKLKNPVTRSCGGRVQLEGQVERERSTM